MEKTTKKRKKSKRAKRRIGLIAVGGLSFVLTICLSIGATLAWFAGSTWASNDLYMGGPVYVEMAGRGENGYVKDTEGNPASDDSSLRNAVWRGGAGTLDIVASARSTGTKAEAGKNLNNILLPGQKLLVYSQARVYSTLYTSTVQDNAYASQSSGANNSNTSDGTYKYYNGKGKVQTTTTSVLRAKFSINIDFDPSVGFNNFTDQIYAQGYPTQSTKYRGEYGSGTVGTPITDDTESFDDATFDDDGNATTTKASLNWADSLGATPYSIERDDTGAVVTNGEKGRRDAVDNTRLVEKTDKDSEGEDVEKWDYDKTDSALAGKINAAPADVTPWVKGANTKAGGKAGDMWQVKLGLSKCIYKWKYVSEKEYKLATNADYRVGVPFDGTINTAGGAAYNSETKAGNGNGFYALYEHDASGNLLESDAYYKARTSNYLKSYVEHYKDDYGRNLVMNIGTSLDELEEALNNSFINLVNQSSDNIWAGNVMGFDATDEGNIKNDTADAEKPSAIGASWLYVDPLIGNDTNASDSASSVGGWWYLVESTGGNKSSKNQVITTVIDNVATNTGTAQAPVWTPTTATTLGSDGVVTYNWGTKEDDAITNDTTKIPANAKSVPIEPTTGASDPNKAAAPFKRYEDDKTNGVRNTDKKILNAKLYEITPILEDQLVATAQDGSTTKTTKVVSYAFPFVNGNFELPGQAMTNIFANAKISFQITFQALQAFFPYANSIDSIPSGTAITGTAKALNIGNAIPIYNEAFDYLSWLSE